MINSGKRAFLIYLAVLSLAGGIVVYLATSRVGPGVSTDAAMMLSAAENLAQRHALVDYQGIGLAQYPPLESAILALGSLVFHQDVFVIGWALCIIVFVASIWFSGNLFYDAFPGQPILAYFGSFIIFSSTSLIRISANIASDPVLLLIVVLFLMCMSRYLKDGAWRYWVASVVLAMLACLERYAGLSLVIAGALITAYRLRGNLRRAGFTSAAFVAVSAAPIFAWGYFHNLAINGALFGRHQPAVPLQNLFTSVQKLLHWFIPLPIVSLVGPLLLLVIILALLLAALFLTHNASALRQLLSPEIAPGLAFLPVYGGVLLFDLSSSELKSINTDRIQLIILPSVLLVLFALLNPLIETARHKFGTGRVYGALIALFLIWSIYPLNTSFKYVRDSMASGDVSAYNSMNYGSSQSSPLALYLKSLDVQDKALYSNGAARAWFILRVRVQAPPQVSSEDRLGDLQAHFAHWPGTGQEAYVIWFNHEGFSPADATPAELASIADVRETYSDAEGAVYLVSAR